MNKDHKALIEEARNTSTEFRSNNFFHLHTTESLLDKLASTLEDASARLDLIDELLTEGYMDLEYDLQAVNQSHRIASGGFLPRETKLNKDDTGKPRFYNCEIYDARETKQDNDHE